MSGPSLGGGRSDESPGLGLRQQPFGLTGVYRDNAQQ